MSTQATNFERYKASLGNDSLEREDWEDYATLGKALSLFSGMGSLFLFFFALYKAKKIPLLGSAGPIAAAAGALASREISVISDNLETIVETTAHGRVPKLISSSKELSNAMFKDTWISGHLFKAYYTNWLNQQAQNE